MSGPSEKGGPCAGPCERERLVAKLSYTEGQLWFSERRAKELAKEILEWRRACTIPLKPDDVTGPREFVPQDPKAGQTAMLIAMGVGAGAGVAFARKRARQIDLLEQASIVLSATAHDDDDLKLVDKIEALLEDPIG